MVQTEDILQAPKPIHHPALIEFMIPSHSNRAERWIPDFFISGIPNSLKRPFPLLKGKDRKGSMNSSNQPQFNPLEAVLPAGIAQRS
ncbi:hypothetical protein [Gracilimonas sp.]|uniref:hypothetical protein n=1 Tax=Gracilimonas sp. TaxID=1974203 RepID=UPI00287244F4|nr:hypothetical protein [Gracilimonas sp.]